MLLSYKKFERHFWSSNKLLPVSESLKIINQFWIALRCSHQALNPYSYRVVHIDKEVRPQLRPLLLFRCWPLVLGRRQSVRLKFCCLKHPFGIIADSKAEKQAEVYFLVFPPYRIWFRSRSYQTFFLRKWKIFPFFAVKLECL